VAVRVRAGCVWVLTDRGCGCMAVQHFDKGGISGGMDVQGALQRFADAMVAYGGHPRTQHAACSALLSFTRKCLGDITVAYYQ
jgi:hypothetical protein